MKIVFIGDGGAGKSTLIKSCSAKKKKLPLGIMSTPGIDIYSGKALSLNDHTKFQIWDFAGQIEYGTLHRVS